MESTENAEVIPPKKKRGNPNFKKGERNSYYPKTEQMEKEEKTEEVESHENFKKDAFAKTEETKSSGNDSIPTDIFSDKMPDAAPLPLEEPAKEKEYAQIPADALKEEKTSGDGKKTESGSGGESSSSGTPAQPAKSQEEIKSQARQSVDFFLSFYDKLHGIGRWAAKTDKNKLMQLHSEGKIDLGKTEVIGGKETSYMDFFDEANKSVDETIVVADEFKEKFIPPAERVCIKRGWLLSDELYLGALLFEDLSTKVSIIAGLKASMNQLLNGLIVAKKKVDNSKNEGRKGWTESSNGAEKKADLPVEEAQVIHDEWKEEEAKN